MLAAIQPRTGTRHWVNSVSTLKQCTGQEHQDLEKLLPAVVAGAVPNEVLHALHAITEFIFIAQSLLHYNETIHSLCEALCEFHHYKSTILNAGGRLGKNGHLNHFQIPKVELAQHVARSIHEMGTPYQWSSDITEHCHITHVKIPYHLSNCQDYHAQCCCFLDQQEKQHLFQLYTTVKSLSSPLLTEMVNEARLMALHYPDFDWISGALPSKCYIGSIHVQRSIFDNPRSCVLAANSTAILLTAQPHCSNLSLQDAPVYLLGLSTVYRTNHMYGTVIRVPYCTGGYLVI